MMSKECALSTCRERRIVQPDFCLLFTAYAGLCESPVSSQKTKDDYRTKFIEAYTGGDCLFEPPKTRQVNKENSPKADS